MDQKKFNERIAMSLLRQCAWVWEHCTKNLHDGRFTLQNILQGLGKNSYKSPTGCVILDAGLCRYWDVFNRQQPIDGLDFDLKEKKSRMSFRTGDDCFYSCSFRIEDVFRVAYDFCSNNACQSLVKKTVFVSHGGGRYASLPDIRPSSYKPEKPHTIRRVPVAAVAHETSPKPQPSLAERLRAALLVKLAA